MCMLGKVCIIHTVGGSILIIIPIRVFSSILYNNNNNNNNNFMCNNNNMQMGHWVLKERHSCTSYQKKLLQLGINQTVK